MTGQGRTIERSLTGIWSGLYSYPDGRSISFVATLIESGGSLSGTTHEPGTLGVGITLYANLIGSRRNFAVTFTKSYDQPDEFHRSPILYDGTLNGDDTEIDGRWTIRNMWSGKFLMIRSLGLEMEVSRKAFERT
jgi:hypothetical protein